MAPKEVAALSLVCLSFHIYITLEMRLWHRRRLVQDAAAVTKTLVVAVRLSLAYLCIRKGLALQTRTTYRTRSVQDAQGGI